MSLKKERTNNTKGVKNKRTGYMLAGAFLVIISLLMLFINYFPIISLEFNYLFQEKRGVLTDNAVINEFINLNSELQHEDKELLVDKDLEIEEFMLFIPKIDMGARIVANVDAFNHKEYIEALDRGIAHASVSTLPGVKGNMFLFAHSGRNFYESRKQNIKFYLLDKLEKGDFVYIKYKEFVYKYEVFDTKKVWPTDTSYLLDNNYNYSKLTLMTCWPAGTDYQRQIVEAKLVDKFLF